MTDWWKASRREFVRLTAAAGFGLASSRLNAAGPQEDALAGSRPVNADEALRQLLAGNRRFTIGQPLTPRRSPKEFRSLAHGQSSSSTLFSHSVLPALDYPRLRQGQKQPEPSKNMPKTGGKKRQN